MEPILDTSSIQKISEALLSEDETERDRALDQLEALLNIDESETCNLLDAQLQKDQDSRRHTDYLLALDAIQSPQAQWLLFEHVRESDFQTPISEPIIKSLLLALGDSDWHVRRSAAAALGRIGEPAVEPLLQALGDSDWHVRQSAAAALGQIGDARAVKPLLQALGYSDWHVRQSAANALGRIGDARAVEPLLQVLGDSDWDVRQSAAAALGQIGDARAVKPLLQALRYSDWHVRQSAAAALGQIGDARAVEPLLQALGDDHWDVRESAAAALGQSHTVDSVKRTLYPNINSPKRFVSGRAAQIDVRLAILAQATHETAVEIEFATGETEAIVQVSMTSDAFTVTPEWLAIRVRRSGNSDTASFSVLPERAGKANLTVEFFRGGQRVGLVVLRAFVFEEGVEPDLADDEIDRWLYKDVLSIEDPGLHINKPVYGRTYVARMKPVANPHEKVVWFDPSDVDPQGRETDVAIDWQEIEGKFEDYRQDFVEYIEGAEDLEEDLNLNVLEEGEPDEQIKMDPLFTEYAKFMQNMRYELESIGNQLCKQMVAQAIRDEVAGLPEGTPIHFGTKAPLSWIPWELVYDKERGVFWGEKYIIGRLAVPDEDTDCERKEVAPDNETGQLINFAGDGLVTSKPHWEPLLKRLYGIFSGLPANGNFEPPFDPPDLWTVQKLSQVAAKGEVVHLTCHGERDKRGNYYLRLGPDIQYHFKGRHLDYLSLRPQSLVFTNACSTASGTLFLNEYSTFAWKLYCSGASAYIGTVAPVPTAWAIQFAESVYDQLINEKKGVGEALWRAKKEFAQKEPSHPFYLLYSLYGDTRWQWEN